MHIEGLVCWRCGASLAALTLPLRRLEECPECTAELHVCRLCQFYDTTVAKHCQEPIADEVKDKTRANFCDYFTPRPGAFAPQAAATGEARARLEALFSGGDAGGETGSADDEARARLEELFGGGGPRK